jgi:hypothetical protein
MDGGSTKIPYANCSCSFLRTRFLAHREDSTKCHRRPAAAAFAVAVAGELTRACRSGLVSNSPREWRTAACCADFPQFSPFVRLLQIEQRTKKTQQNTTAYRTVTRLAQLAFRREKAHDCMNCCGPKFSLAAYRLSYTSIHLHTRPSSHSNVVKHIRQPSIDVVVWTFSQETMIRCGPQRLLGVYFFEI